MLHFHPIKKLDDLKRLTLAILINLTIVVTELIFSILSSSLSLMSDALHNLTDISSMIIGYSAEKLMARPSTQQKTYGCKKAEFLSAFVNTLLLFVAVIYIGYEAILRLFNQTVVLSGQMMLIGIIAILGNGVATWLLASRMKENINIKAVWLHSLQDTLVSVGVVAGAAIIYWTGWNIIDPLISLFIALLIIKSSYQLLKEAIDSLLDAVPSKINFIELKNDLLRLDQVKQVKDLHIWAISSKEFILTAHLEVRKQRDIPGVFIQAKKLVADKYGIQHVTFQILPVGISAVSSCRYCN